MQNQEVNRQLQKLKNQWELIPKKCSGDLEVEAQWARYMCIRCAGFFETALREILGKYLEDTSSSNSARYGKQALKRNQNPGSEQIVQILGFFNSSWRDNLENNLCWTDGGKDAFDSVINIRNNIAHGGDAGITLGTLTQYRDKAIKVLEYIEELCQNSHLAP